MNAYIDTYVYKCIYTCIQTYIRTHAYKYTHTYAYMCIHTHTHTYIHTHIHTCMHGRDDIPDKVDLADKDGCTADAVWRALLFVYTGIVKPGEFVSVAYGRMYTRVYVYMYVLCDAECTIKSDCSLFRTRVSLCANV